MSKKQYKYIFLAFAITLIGCRSNHWISSTGIILAEKTVQAETENVYVKTVTIKYFFDGTEYTNNIIHENVIFSIGDSAVININCKKPNEIEILSIKPAPQMSVTKIPNSVQNQVKSNPTFLIYDVDEIPSFLESSSEAELNSRIHEYFTQNCLELMKKLPEPIVFSLIVKSDGTVELSKYFGAIENNAENELDNAIKSMVRWSPGIKNSKCVNVLVPFEYKR